MYVTANDPNFRRERERERERESGALKIQMESNVPIMQHYRVLARNWIYRRDNVSFTGISRDSQNRIRNMRTTE